jgi:hypothetical protein
MILRWRGGWPADKIGAMTPTLTDALQRVYDAFQTAVPARIKGCPCCTDPDAISVLHSTPLRALTADDLGDYADSVFLTVGDLADFRYFLPRILELAITVPSFGIGLEVVLGKLALAEWSAWKASDLKLVRSVLDIWFDDVAHSAATDWDGYDDSLDSLLCGFARAGLDPVVYIERLLPAERNFALNVLWEINSAELRRRGRMGNGFWKDNPFHEAVVARLMADDIQAIVA